MLANLDREDERVIPIAVEYPSPPRTGRSTGLEGRWLWTSRLWRRAHRSTPLTWAHPVVAAKCAT